jgi:hypothetical protein
MWRFHRSLDAGIESCRLVSTYEIIACSPRLSLHSLRIQHKPRDQSSHSNECSLPPLSLTQMYPAPPWFSVAVMDLSEQGYWRVAEEPVHADVDRQRLRLLAVLFFPNTPRPVADLSRAHKCCVLHTDA